MSRKYRICYPGATYHIHARGNRRGAIFYEDSDYHYYLKTLESVRSKYPFILHSYCFMTNHLHLQIETITSPISHIMKEIHARYAIYFNHKYDFDGHVFQGRYGSKVIESIHYFLTVSRYIHRNPLEANMIINMAEYPWSSYSSYIHNKKNPHIDPTRTYSYFKNPVHEQYRLYVENETKEDELIWVPR
ncbi:transposase [Mesobacillus maritimus]|uniref:transposase n=1 Tax=Mesobacillus maritimus TaxID=1643336 RepID=UPI00384AA46F